jgi:integrase/recombinase XerD
MEQFFKDRRTLAQMRKGFLGTYLELMAGELSARGYAHRTARRYLQLAECFGGWLKDNSINLHEITPDHTKEFLDQRTQRPNYGDPFALKFMLNILRQQGVYAPEFPKKRRTQAEDLVEKFSNYLTRERGLAPSTILYYTDFSRKFLSDKFADGPANLSSVSSADLIAFVQRQASILQTKRAKGMTTALRSFLRYAKYQGYIDTDLAKVVPTVAHWAMATLPKNIPSDKCELFLSRCKRRTPVELRNYAILLLLARLGLRAIEIISLKLEDIDWETGWITIRGKAGYDSKLPLPIDVGEAIAAYLKDGRPKTNLRSLFLRSKAPIAALKTSTDISSVVRRALLRSGIDSPRTGAHQFRHGLATRMLQQGATLVEIGEVLRHRSPQTTAIYTKVDLDSLQLLAMPWPGGMQ